MKIGILGAGPVGSCFAEMLPRYGHEVHIYDTDNEKTKGLGNANICTCEGEVGEKSDFLLCCTDMLSSDALTKAADAMKPGGRHRKVVSGDFSAKIPEYEAFRKSRNAGKHAYWTIHTMGSPKMGFKNMLVIEIPVENCTDNGRENPYISEFRKTLAMAGSRFRVIWTPEEHDRIMGRIQGATSAENICTAKTLADLEINPLERGNIYSNKFDRIKFLMSLRAVGKKGSSNHRVYGLIATMNPYSLENIQKYLEVLEGFTESNEAYAMAEDAVRRLGKERIKRAAWLWDSKFGTVSRTENSYSSHIAEAILWSQEGEYPLGIFQETPSPPYRMRELMALKALSMHRQCIENMHSRETNDRDFLEVVRAFREWAEKSRHAGGWEALDGFEREFFEPVRERFPEELETITEKTNQLIGMLQE